MKYWSARVHHWKCRQNVVLQQQLELVFDEVVNIEQSIEVLFEVTVLRLMVIHHYLGMLINARWTLLLPVHIVNHRHHTYTWNGTNEW
jgi:hypothetical protein